MKFLLKFWIFLKNFRQFMWWLEELFLIGFCVWIVFHFDLLSKDFHPFFVILNLEIQSYNLNFEFLVLAMILFDEIFCGFESILLEVTLWLKIMHVLSLLNYWSYWLFDKLFFNRLQWSQVHHFIFLVPKNKAVSSQNYFY